MRELESRAFVLLRRPPGAPPLADDEAEALQERHLAYLEELAAAGKLVGAGPFSDQPDESLRGLCVMATTLDEARELMEQDPSVRAGRLSVEAMTWWTRKGTVRFHRG